MRPSAPGTTPGSARPTTRPTPDVDGQAARRAETDSRAARIDDTLSRITAAHAGLALPRRVGDPDTAEPAAAGLDDPQLDTPQLDADGHPVPPRRRRRILPRVLAAALSLTVFGAITFGWAAKGWLSSAIAEVQALDPTSDLIVDADAQKGDENLLILTTGAGAGSAPGGDTITLAHRPIGGGELTVLSFPSELQIDRPECRRWNPDSRSYSDQVASAEARTRLGSAFQIGGPLCVTQAVQQLSGIAVTGFVGLDVDGLGSLASALDGVAVCAPRPVEDAVLGSVVPAAGPTELAGRQATDYARAADVQGDPSTGRGRIERQQLLLADALQEAIGGAGLLDVSRLGQLRLPLGKALISDGVDLDDIAALGESLRNLEADGVTFAAVPTSGDGNSVLRDVDASHLFSAVRSDTPLPAGAGDAAVPAQLTISVLNATDRSGLGAQVAGTLASFGFRTGDVGTAEQVTEQTLIRFSPDQAAAASLLATTVPAATSVPDPGTTGVLQLVIGSSYDDVLLPPAGAPTGQGSTPAEPARAASCP